MRVQLTAKGQVTIPVELRRELHLHAGEELLLEADSGTGELKLRREASLPDLYRSAPATRDYPGRREMRRQAATKAATHRVMEMGRAA
jgi:AbrB family looped-hinge helix DNA binding protein